MRIAVLHESPKPTWASSRLLRAVANSGHRAVYLQVQFLAAGIGTRCPLVYQSRCLDVDAIIVRSLGKPTTIETMMKRLAVLMYAEEAGITIVNPAKSMMLARDKFTSLRILAENGIKTPRTFVTEDPYEAVRLAQEWGRIVIKPLSGTMGLGAFLADNPDIAYRIASLVASLRQPIYVQEYVEKKGSRDIRVFVVGERVVAAAYRIAKPGEWRTNVAQGAITEPAKTTPELEELAIRATKALSLVYAGVDVAETPENQLVVFEVNAAPLWRGLYRATGVDPAPIIVEEVVRLCKK